jgi:TonB-dependent starch-binding outer membrane protein SusC
MSFVLLLGLVGGVFAQGRAVTGVVTSGEDGQGLPGANVLVKGTTNGTMTDVQGRFTITVPEDAVLVFSSIGFVTEEVIVGNRASINLTLVPDIKQLSEVVVTGYGGLQDKREVTGSIVQIKGDEIANLASPSFAEQLAGRASGVQVTQTSGLVGAAPLIRIRGTGSITSGADPLFVIDGVPMTTGNQSGTTNTNPLADINPNDILSMEVLKDGAATAIYGSRAANGVILITTKRGSDKKGTFNVDFNSYTGFSRVASRFDLLNAEEFVEIANEKFTNRGAAGPARLGDVNTDWQDVIFRTGVMQNYNLNFSGSAEKTNYYFSVGYTEQQGGIVANSMNRMSFRGSVDHKINKFLEAGTSVTLSNVRNVGLNTGSNALSGNVAGAVRMLPNVSPYDENHPTGFNIEGRVLGRGPNLQTVHNNYTNIAYVLENNQLRATNQRLLSNSYLQLNIIDGLTFRTQFGTDLLPTTSFLSWDPIHGDGGGSNGRVSQTQRSVDLWNLQNILNFNRTFGAHKFGLTLGQEMQKTNISTFTAGGTDFSDDFFIQNGLITGSFATQLSSGGFWQRGFDSYFSRLNYSFANRYLLSVSARNDGISDLPAANRRGNFFGASVGYRLSEEDFYKNSVLATVANDVKFRASMGQVGNVDIGFFPFAGTFGSGQYASMNGIAFSQAGNNNLRWESSTKYDAGLEMAFLNNRITASVDYFQNTIDGLILNAPTPASLGIPGNSIRQNIGSMVNRGIEFELGATIIDRGGFRWNSDINFTSLRNEITSLTNNLEGAPQDMLFAYHINRVGHPIGSLYGFNTAGVNPANGNPMFEKGDGRIVQRNPATGGYSFYNEENPGDMSLTAGAALSQQDVKDGGDRRILGNTMPTWFGGFNNKFAFGGFDLEVFTRFSGGNYVMNVTRQEALLNQDFQGGGRELLNRWTPTNTNTDVPRLYDGASTIINLNGQATSRFVERGDFVRVQNIVLGYRLPASVTRAANVRNVRVFAQVQNPFLFTNYSGLDPELNTFNDTNSQFGLDNATNPFFRTYTFGFNIGL